MHTYLLITHQLHGTIGRRIYCHSGCHSLPLAQAPLSCLHTLMLMTPAIADCFLLWPGPLRVAL